MADTANLEPDVSLYLSRRTRHIAAALLLIFGVQLWLVVGHGQVGSSPRLWWYLPLLPLTFIPPLSRRITAVLDRLRQPSPPIRTMTSITIALAAAAYFIFTAHYQHRDLFPKLHDEHMHLLQMQMLAHGRLWMPPHPLADSFESFHIFVKPVYAAVYFPGTALVYVPTVWLKLPNYLLPALVAGAAVGMLYRVVAELIDGLAGLLAALLLVSLDEFRFLSMVVMSHTLMVLFGVALTWAYLRWRHSPSLAWTAFIGALAGWAAITRPIDALCFAAPVGIAMLSHLLKTAPRRILPMAILLVLSAAPFLLLQLVMNLGISRNPFLTPDRLYSDLYMPGMSFGFHRFDPATRPATALPQVIKYYHEFTVPAAQQHRPQNVLHALSHDRLPSLARFTLPSPLLLLLVPIGALAWRGRRLVLLAMLPLFLACYMLFAYFLTHYTLIAAPAIILAVMLGWSALQSLWPRFRAPIVTFSTLWIVLLSLHGLPELNRFVQDDVRHMPTMRFNAELPALVQVPAIVLYHFNPDNNPHEEPVYNIDVAFPDDAPIIRAQDLSAAQNLRLFKYYAAIAPQRRVYRVDRLDGTDRGYRPESLVYLGTVSELSQKP